MEKWIWHFNVLGHQNSKMPIYFDSSSESSSMSNHCFDVMFFFLLFLLGIRLCSVQKPMRPIEFWNLLTPAEKRFCKKHIDGFQNKINETWLNKCRPKRRVIYERRLWAQAVAQFDFYFGFDLVYSQQKLVQNRNKTISLTFFFLLSKLHKMSELQQGKKSNRVLTKSFFHRFIWMSRFRNLNQLWSLDLTIPKLYDVICIVITFALESSLHYMHSLKKSRRIIKETTNFQRNLPELTNAFYFIDGYFN